MDRLSELPECLIFHIFSFLPMSDVVRTTILSKYWKNLWTTTPFLDFDYYTVSFINNGHQIFVNRALSRWDGVRVLKFKIEPSYHDYRDMDSWLLFAKKNEVEELHIHMLLESVTWPFYFDHDDELNWLPQCLYSCTSLKLLSCNQCVFRINENVVQWNQLKSLTITEGFGFRDDDMSKILSGSPKLEVLILSFVERGERLCIRTSSLKELSIYKYSNGYDAVDDLDLDSELRIWTPNLEKLELKGIPYGKCLLMNVSSLNHATLAFSRLGLVDEDFVGVGFGQILPAIRHVENVVLLFNCIEDLAAMEKRCKNSSFPNVKSLALQHRLNEYEYLLGLLEIFPQLNKLILGEDLSYHDDQESLNFDAKIEANIPNWFLQQLRIVEVTWVETDEVFPFLETLLKCASKLGKMVFRVKETNRPSSILKSLVLASERLLSMPRSSPTAQVNISLKLCF